MLARVIGFWSARADIHTWIHYLGVNPGPRCDGRRCGDHKVGSFDFG